MPLELIALVAFWAVAVKLWVLDGPKIPVICIGLWLIAYFLVPRLHWPGAVFLIVECILAVILLIIDRYKSAMLKS